MGFNGLTYEFGAQGSGAYRLRLRLGLWSFGLEMQRACPPALRESGRYEREAKRGFPTRNGLGFRYRAGLPRLNPWHAEAPRQDTD